MTGISDFIPLASPLAGYFSQKQEIDQSIQAVLEKGRYILGTEVELFEKEFAEYIGVPFGIGVASGTDAIEIALRSLEIGAGDLVFTVSHTAGATVAAICRCGAVPVFVDIDPKTCTMAPNHLEQILVSVSDGKFPLSGIPKAIVPVHLYGQPADMPAILDIAKKFELYVVEDCAQAHGAQIRGKCVGSFGHMGAFSFYPTKNLGAMGDGGIVTTEDSRLWEKLKSLREYGWKQRYISETDSGINSRLDEIQAAVLRVKLRVLEKNNLRRIEIAEKYHQALEKQGSVHIPRKSEKHFRHVYHLYVIQSALRDRIIRFFDKNSIGTGIHYPVPVHLQPAFCNLKSVTMLPHTEKVCNEILSIPIYPELSDEQTDRICHLLEQIHNIEE